MKCWACSSLDSYCGEKFKPTRKTLFNTIECNGYWLVSIKTSISYRHIKLTCNNWTTLWAFAIRHKIWDMDRMGVTLSSNLNKFKGNKVEGNKVTSWWFNFCSWENLFWMRYFVFVLAAGYAMNFMRRQRDLIGIPDYMLARPITSCDVFACCCGIQSVTIAKNYKHE